MDIMYVVETEAWFIDSLEEWRKAKNLSNFVLLGHSFGGYVAAKYALKVDQCQFAVYSIYYILNNYPPTTLVICFRH